MKKLLFTVIIASSMQLLSMEEDRQIFPWEQSPLELKTEIIKKTFGINVQSSIDRFKKIRLISKEFNTKQSITTFLEALNVKFPGQEIRFARALHNQYAKEWLNKKYPNLPYEPIPFENPRNITLKFIKSDDVAGLKKLLLEGYDPEDLRSYALVSAEGKSKISFLKLLVSFGACANDPFDVVLTQSNIQLAKKENQKELLDEYSEILDYLISESSE